MPHTIYDLTVVITGCVSASFISDLCVVQVISVAFGLYVDFVYGEYGIFEMRWRKRETKKKSYIIDPCSMYYFCHSSVYLEQDIAQR